MYGRLSFTHEELAEKEEKLDPQVLPPRMKNTGMSRKLDVLGRIVIPAEIRKSLDLKEGGVLDISLDEEKIVLTPRRDACVFCGSETDLKGYEGRMVCSDCLGALAKL
jgi:transcriptional pleiotropic regulator of transition state genes